MNEKNNIFLNRGFSVMKKAKKPILLSIVLAIMTFYVSNCGWQGNVNSNYAPTVNFVNTPKDANIDSVSQAWNYNMPFDLFNVVFDSITGEPLDTVSLYDEPYRLVQLPDLVLDSVTTLSSKVVPGEPVYIKGVFDGDTVIYQEGVDYQILDPEVLIIQVISPADLGHMEDISATGDTIVYFVDYKLETPNYSVFSYAPIIYWYGSDRDGFVESYSYADIKKEDIDAANITLPGYISQITDDEWINTNATNATIYLLSETGDTTEHVVYLKCYDNSGASSNVVYRTFFRSNQPPNVPEVKWDQHSDDRFANLMDIRSDSIEGITYTNTLISLPEITPIWGGITFRWRGDDPDDKELYTIPLTFQYYLMSLDENDMPVDTISEWSYFENISGQEIFTDEQSVTFVDLETGDYLFSVWSFDDGFERSPSSADIYFRCVHSYTEDEKKSIILYDETKNTTSFWNLPNMTVIDSFYIDMMHKMDTLFDGSLYDFTIDNIYDNSGNQDVMYWDNSASDIAGIIPIEMLLKYKLIIMYAEDHKQIQTNQYRGIRDTYFQRYLQAGGRLWLIGRQLLNGSFGIPALHQSINNDLLNMMQIDQAYVYSFGNQLIEFKGGFNAVDALDTLSIDQVKSDSLGFLVPTGPGLPEVDWIGRDEDATTLYYFKSVYGETSQLYADSAVGIVMDITDNPPYPGSSLYPNPTGSECWITVQDDHLIEVTSVINYSKPLNGVGEVIDVTSDDDIKVTYPYIVVTYSENTTVNATPAPTPTVCTITTSHYDQDFSDTTSTQIYNQTKDSYGTAINTNVKVVTVNYPTDTVTYNETNAVVRTAAGGQFDPTPDSCAVMFTFSRNYVIGIDTVTNNTQGVTGTVSSLIGNIAVIHTNGTTWAATDDVDGEVSHLEYWQPGDTVQVVYDSDLYWEKGDDVRVNYSYNPTSEAHLKPCAIRYEYYEVYNFSFFTLYYRTACFTFPLYFMENTPSPTADMGRVDKVVYEMLDWFLDPNIHFGE